VWRRATGAQAGLAAVRQEGFPWPRGGGRNYLLAAAAGFWRNARKFMSASRNRWLLEQLPLWEGEGLLTAEAARTLRARHAVEAAGPGLGQIMMGALGALLLGSGLIAVIGHN